MRLEFSDEKFSGLFINFCGLDGTGKTSLIKKLEEKLLGLGYNVFGTSQPTREVRQTELFRRFVDSDNHDGLEYRSLSLLTVSDRVQHSTQVILPMLKKGYVVLCDRYYHSALVNLRARGYKDDKWIYEISQYLPCPDIAFFLNVDFDLALERVRSRPTEKDRWIDIEFHKKLYDEFKYVCGISNGVSVESSNSLEITFEKVWQIVLPYLDKLNNVK